jgi:hypothetical protein
MKRCVAFTICSLLAWTSQAQTQTVIAPSRNMDWSGAGVSGGIPNRTAICATLNPGATATQINDAIAACASGQVVFLNAGTYTLSSGIVLSKSNVTLRGAGANSTKLIINGTTSGCHLFYNSAIRMCAGGGNIGVDSAEHTASWTGGYAKGTSVITLSNVTGLTVGSTIFLDQLNDAADGYPTAGDIYVCETTAPCSTQGGNGFARTNRAQVQISAVTAINGNNVTISPAVYLPNFRASQSPGAWWANSGTVIQYSGIEDMTVDFTGSGSVGIEIVNATNTWVKGLRLIFNSGPGSFVFHVLVVNGFRVTTRNNYFYGPTVQGNTQYAYTPHVSGGLLFENNILHHNVSPMVPNDPESGSVYAYNFVTDSYYNGSGVQLHNAGAMMNLYEGNNMSAFAGDVIHGTHFFETLFRNHLDGYSNNPPAGNNTAVLIETNNRFFNVVGNVLGHSHFNTYQVVQAGNGDAIYGLGWQGDNSGTPVSNDPNVLRTLFRWGNYDTVTGTSRFVASEVPSTITNFPNPVPATQALPPSLYLTSKPSWFGSTVWPPIGPDVTGGDISGYGGHANKIPARRCFESAAIDSAYGSANIRLFDAAACYGQAVPSAPAPPTNVRVVIR